MEKELKSGFTTGSCVAAAAKLALEYLILEEKKEYVEIKTLNEKKILIPVSKIKKDKRGTRVSVIKYSGDDPDVTNGIEIVVRVEISKEKSFYDLKGYRYKNILISGGRGVGIATKNGLAAEKNKYAINPGPQRMICNEILEVLNKIPYHEFDIKVTIIVPLGIKKSKETLNEKLGIVRGISILGTTGIVKPMSEESLKESLHTELKVIKENSDKDWVIFVFGNYGERFCRSMKLDLNQVVVISNYIGFMLEAAVKLEFKRVLLLGHIGKAIKIAGGIFNTHSKVADARLEIMAANAILCNESIENIKKILSSNTVDESCEYITQKKIFNLISNKVAKKSEEYVKNKLECEALIFSFKGETLGSSDNFFKLVGEINEKD